jgi:hypothetical protein
MCSMDVAKALLVKDLPEVLISATFWYAVHLHPQPTGRLWTENWYYFTWNDGGGKKSILVSLLRNAMAQVLRKCIQALN